MQFRKRNVRNQREVVTTALHVTTTLDWYFPEGEPHRWVIFLPALGVSIDYYRTMAAAWSDMGYVVVAVETRGMKHSSVSDVHEQNFGYREVLDDVSAVVELVERRANGNEIVLAGHSLGGQWALLWASAHPAAVRAVALLAGGSNYFGSLPPGRRLRRRGGLWLVRAVTRTIGYFPGDRLGFAGRQPAGIMADWSEEGLSGSYRIAGDERDYEGALAQLELPVLMLSLPNDALVPKSCADFLARKLPRCEVTQLELPPSVFGRRIDHFRWVRDASPVLHAFHDWMSASIAPGASRGQGHA